MKRILILIILFTNMVSYAQEKKFLNSGKTFKIIKKYYVNEIILNSDSTFVRRYYEFEDNKNIDNYKSLKPELKSTGTYLKSGKNYVFAQKGSDNFANNYFKLTQNKLISLYLFKGKLKKGGRFKLISK